jgi:oligosaccharide reducing-end xylanase
MNMLSVAPSPTKTNRECTLLKIGVGFFLITALTASVSLAGSVAAPYEIGTWEGFRPAAITYTFDDNLTNQYYTAVPMFHQAGFKMTLFTVIDYWTAFTWSMAQTAASYGDEIGSHTVTHRDLSTLTIAQQIPELINSRTAINANVTNQQCVTLAYPDCNEGNETYVARYYIAARGCSAQLESSTPADFMNINSFVCGSVGPIKTPQDFNDIANAAAAANEWCVYLIHAIDNDNGYSPLPSSTLQASVNYMSTNQNMFWVETFGNVVRYIQERNASSVAETSNSDSSITIQVTNSLTNIFNYPITLRRPLPTGWPAAAVSQNNQPISAQLVTVSSTNYVMFDVVPNGGDVILSKTVLPFTISNPGLITPTSLTFCLNGQANVSYAIYTSTDLVNWSPVQTNTLVSTYTNFTVDASNTLQFYRAQWVP